MGKKDPGRDGGAARALRRAAPTKKKIDEKKPTEIFDQMETFARYGFNKSHSAAYALVSYQTAYLKTHYPVEFMAALLTSEMGDTDKVIKNLAECRDKDIEVLAPDINESLSNFTPVGDKIRFGMAAVKNVGEKAVEVILRAATKDGPFDSLFDFCRRVDMTAVNRRVIENLIKCGAYDSTQVSRTRMFGALDDAMKVGSSVSTRSGKQSDRYFRHAGYAWQGRKEGGGRLPSRRRMVVARGAGIRKRSAGFLYFRPSAG